MYMHALSFLDSYISLEEHDKIMNERRNRKKGRRNKNKDHLQQFSTESSCESIWYLYQLACSLIIPITGHESDPVSNHFSGGSPRLANRLLTIISYLLVSFAVALIQA